MKRAFLSLAILIVVEAFAFTKAGEPAHVWFWCEKLNVVCPTGEIYLMYRLGEIEAEHGKE